jgi:hypothetical protein
MRRSGQSIFSRPRPIDISAARRAGIGIDLDMDDEEEEEELGRPLVRNPVVFDAEEGRKVMSDMPRVLEGRELEDVWAELG